MNYGRLVLPAVAATVVDAIYGFLVYGLLLAGDFAMFPGVYRPADVGMAYLPLTAGIMVASGAGAQLISRIGARPLLLTGVPTAAGGLYWLSRLGEHCR